MKMTHIKHQIENNIEGLKLIVDKSNSHGDLCKHYGLPVNGKQYSYFKILLRSNKISSEHWDSHKKRRLYPNIVKTCPICRNTFVTQSGHPREKETCSCKCSNIYFSTKRHTEESNKKRGERVKEYCLSVGKSIGGYKIKCVICGTEKETHKKNQKCCSNKCSRKLMVSNPLYIQKLRDAQNKLVAEGRHKGWKKHCIGQTPSYAERFFMGVLKDYNISYEYDKQVGKYHIDFVLGNKSFALEIDGRQHKEKSLKYRDDKKDKFLIDNGWEVYRIEWNSINTDAGKQMMKEKIQKFLGVYRKLADVA